MIQALPRVFALLRRTVALGDSTRNGGPCGRREKRSSARAQSNVVGVAILLGITVVALGSLTAGVGTVVDEHAASADADRAAADLAAAIRPVEVTGRHSGTVAFTEGSLRTVSRDLRVLNASDVVSHVPVNALVFEAGDRGATVLAGAVVRRHPVGAQLRRPPPITASRDPAVLVVGAARLNGSVATHAAGGARLRVRTRVSHERQPLGNGTFRVAVETATPGVWERHFARRNASVLDRREFDGDGTPSVVARFPGNRTGYLVVHRVRLKVFDG